MSVFAVVVAVAGAVAVVMVAVVAVDGWWMAFVSGWRLLATAWNVCSTGAAPLLCVTKNAGFAFGSCLRNTAGDDTDGEGVVFPSAGSSTTFRGVVGGVSSATAVLLAAVLVLVLFALALSLSEAAAAEGGAAVVRVMAPRVDSLLRDRCDCDRRMPGRGRWVVSP